MNATAHMCGTSIDLKIRYTYTSPSSMFDRVASHLVYVMQTVWLAASHEVKPKWPEAAGVWWLRAGQSQTLLHVNGPCINIFFSSKWITPRLERRPVLHFREN